MLGPGGDLWKLLEVSMTYEQILQSLSNHYCVPPEQIADDVARMLDHLINHHYAVRSD